MRVIQIVSILFIVLLIIGCYPTTNRVLFTFEDTGNDVTNEQKCYELCKGRERTSMSYRCDYEPVICDDGECLCKTY